MRAAREVKSILLVEDDPDQASTIRRKLERLPASVMVAATGDEGVYHLLKAKQDGSCFDLIVLDLCVPKDEGDDVEDEFGVLFTDELSRRPQLLGRDTSIILYTNHPTYPTCVAAIHAGAVDYIPKMERQPGGHEVSNLQQLYARCEDILFPDSDREGFGEWFDGDRANESP